MKKGAVGFGRQPGGCIGPRRRLRGAALAALLVSIVGCNKQTAPNPTFTPVLTVPVNAVIINGPATLTTLGERAQLTATAKMGDGTQVEHTSTAQWTSSDPKAIAITSSGMVTAIGGGKTQIQATIQGVSGTKQVDVILGPPVYGGDTSGRIDLQTAADIISANQNAIGGSSYRTLGVITRWELPIAVYIDSTATASTPLIQEAMDYWRTYAGLSFTIVGANVEPRILVRLGTDGLVNGRGARALIDGTYPNNRARSGLILVAPPDVSAGIFEHEFEHVLGMQGDIQCPCESVVGRPSPREVNLFFQLYMLPHGTRVETDGTWKVVK